MNFPESNGWSNEATWTIFSNFTRFEETSMPMKLRAQEGARQVHYFVERLVHSWYEGTVSGLYCEVLRCMGQEFMESAMHYVSWSYIYDALRGEPVPEPPNELTAIAHELLTIQNWQEIVAGATSAKAADTMLSAWFEKHCLTWVAIPDGRKLHGLISKFTLAVMDIYMNAANWDEVTEVLIDI